jgi:uncharacterized membrane protein YdjX (TVP38/TMEM64 family)
MGQDILEPKAGDRKATDEGVREGMADTIMAWWQQLQTLEFWEAALAGFEGLGPALPILLAMVESFVPALPLVAIVTLNVAAHGAVQGFLYSWLGTALGSTLVFLFWRRVVKRFFWRVARRGKYLQKAERWVSRFDRRALFVLVMLPFTPSAFVNLAFGISEFDERQYLATITGAKFVMIALLAMFGQSLVYALEEPQFLALAAAVLVGLYWLSKKFCKKNHL